MLESTALLLAILCPIIWAAPPQKFEPFELLSWDEVKDSQPSQNQYCYAESSDPYRLFGSWTSYFAVDNERAEAVEIPSCRPKSFWLFVRHGSRNPGVGQIDATNDRGPVIKDAVLKNHLDGKGHLCGKDLGAFMGNFTLFYPFYQLYSHFTE